MNRAEMQDLLNNLIDTAISCAEALGDKSSHLVDIAEFIRNRKH
jgi:hypothetical protein